MDRHTDNNEDDSNNGISEIAQRIRNIVQNKLKPELNEQLGFSNDRNHGEQQQRHKKTLRQLLGHTQHCFTVLLQKQTSLCVGVTVLRTVTWPAIWNAIQEETAPKQRVCSSSLERLTTLLQHLFLQLLRIHDGFILLASGECRHPGDLQQARATKYPSRLPQSDHIYNPHLTYSGAAWDEWKDSRNGLNVQWRKFIAEAFPTTHDAKRFWNGRMRALTASLYTNQLDTTALQQEFLDFALQRIRPQLQTRFTKVKLSFQDKLEELRLTLPRGGASTSWHLQRQGKKFQIQDAQGALPLPISTNGSVRDMWLQIMALPKQPRAQRPATQRNPAGAAELEAPSVEEAQPKLNKKKKRRVIVDSDEEEDEEDKDDVMDVKPKGVELEQQQLQPTGLVTKVLQEQPQQQTNNDNNRNPQANSANTPSKGHNVSLDAIKQRMGVNAQDLEHAHETMAAEEESPAETTAEAAAASAAEQQHEKDQAEERVRRGRRTLRRLLVNFDPDAMGDCNKNNRHEWEQVWNAREGLRRALLNAGNIFLTATAQEQTNDRIQDLKQAYRYFEESADQVSAQRNLYERMKSLPHQDQGDDASRYRELLLFAGRADLNCGITFVELWQEGHKGGSALKGASDFFTTSKSHASQMQTQARLDRASAQEEDEKALYTVCDELEALKLQSMSSRWLAIAMWHQDRFRDSLKEFQQSAQLIDAVGFQSLSSWLERYPDLWESELELRVECYQSWVMVFDLASGELQRISANTLQIDLKRAEELFEEAQMLLGKATEASKTLEDRLLLLQNNNMLAGGNLTEFMADKGIRASQELVEAQEEHSKWWAQTKTSLLRSIRRQSDANRATFVPASHNNHENENDDGGGPMMMPFGDDDDVAAEEEMPIQPFFSLTLAGEPALQNRRTKNRQPNHGGSRTHHNLNRGRLDNDGANTSHRTGSSNRSNDNQQPRRYRKWGDELLPQKQDPNTGKMVPDLKYPCVPPPMPPEVLALAKKLGHPLVH